MGSQIRRPGIEPNDDELDRGYISCSFGPTSEDKRRERELEVEREIQEEQDRRQHLAGEECQDAGGDDPA